jgi:hypothetical protein
MIPNILIHHHASPFTFTSFKFNVLRPLAPSRPRLFMSCSGSQVEPQGVALIYAVHRGLCSDASINYGRLNVSDARRHRRSVAQSCAIVTTGPTPTQSILSIHQPPLSVTGQHSQRSPPDAPKNNHCFTRVTKRALTAANASRRRPVVTRQQPPRQLRLLF